MYSSDHSSYRVTGDAVVMGEAAGVTSALAVAAKSLPHSVPFTEVARALAAVRQDVVERAGTDG